ncbi:general transcription factor 3C polypeptide 1-like isoform X2 [Nilaparvata lugens]|uniref:general transcription factor 3C polypeptide 1-like isoform X2 n=1 Tax=Nilaparvata lugens TaxID=108931 RepID=UPI00193CBA0E|nr:general transcription factor 3C polypeptide 1-like isoform X2 [Nilaparvata lugens]
MTPSELLDEIALEGLDGITIEALWVRLRLRKGFLLPPKDDHAKAYIWNFVRRLRSVAFYKLQEPRKPLVVFDRWSNVEDDLGLVIDPKPLPVDIYPHCLISDCEKKIQGSCSSYYTRQVITNKIRKRQLPEVLEEYDPESIVIVANQHARRIALMGTHHNPDLELTDFMYCCLERIGRSRYHGEITQGKMSLQVLGVDSKTLFYFRKFLLEEKLIIAQLFHMKVNNISVCGKLIHLPRFYHLVKPKFVTLTENIVEFLYSQPNYVCEVTKLKESLGITCCLRKLTKIPEFQKYVRSDSKALYRSVYPDAEEKDWKQQKQDKERRIHALFLVDPSIDLKEFKRKLAGNDDDEENKEEEADEHSQGFLDQSLRVFDRPIVLQVWKILENAGPNGMSATELTKATGLGKLNMRMIIKYMEKSKICVSFLADVSRQRVRRYVVNSGNRMGDIKAEFNTEELKLITLKNVETKLRDIEGNSAGEGCSTSETKPSTSLPDSTEKHMSVNEVASTSTSVLQDSTIIKVGEANENILPDENDGETSVSKVQAVNEEHHDEIMEIVEERSAGEKEGDGAMGEDSVGKGGEEVVEKVISKQLKGKKAVKRSRGGEKETEPKKMKVKIVADLNNEKEIEVEENSLSQVRDVSMESSDKKTDSVNEPSVSSKMTVEEASKIEINIEITDDLNWLKERGKFGKFGAEGAKTVRSLKRWNWILEAIQAQKVITNFKNLQSVIDDHERAEGNSGRIDRKSLVRILYRMGVERLIKFYKVYLKSGDTVQDINFICNPSVTPDDPIIKFAIDLAKLKFTSKVKLQHDNALKQESKAVAKEDVVLTNKFDFSEEYKSNLDVPKFMRMRYLHMFMYYLVYGYEGDVNLDQTEAAQQIRVSQGFEVDDLESMSFIYVPNASWKMFVPPLPEHHEYKDGWALLADIILRLPLSMFMNLVRLSHIVPNVELYLDHPVKRHILVKDLPVNVRNCLLHKRKYVFSIYEVATRLAYIGLVQLGPQNMKEKDHVFMYVNRNGLLLDTKISRLGYHKISDDIDYNEIRYYFEAMVDVERYWLDLWKICMHTKLGNRSSVIGTDVIIEHIQDKPDMINILLARTREEVVEKDVGYLPGDKLGAAGFDSALFSHLKRNWAFKPFPKSRLKSVLTVPDKPKQKLRKPFKFAESRNQMVYSLLAKRRKNLVGTTRKQVTTTTVKSSIVNRKQVLSHKPRVTVRHVKPRRPVKQRRPFYDQVDREALNCMSKLRVNWSKAEDKLLLLCKVVQSMISPQIKSAILGNMYISFREILHKTFPNSRNKTSRACQRRINYMLRSQSTCHSLSLCIEELRQDPVIMETYGDLFEKLKAKYENKQRVIENKAQLVAEWNMHFKNLYDILEKRFDDFSIMSLSSVTSTLPDTIEEFHANYNVIEPTKKVKTKHVFNTVQNINDIYSSVINSTIHSALCCSSDKTSWSYHLFSVYQQYPEKLLRSSLAKLRTSLMVSLKRAWSRTKMRSGNYLPLTASPYRLSISYINLMAAKYTSDIFPESYELQKAIVQSRKLDVQATCGGMAAAIVRLMTDEWVDFEIGIPDQVIVLNPNIQGKDEKYTRLMKRYQEILSSYKHELLTTSCLFKKDNYSTVDSVEDDEDSTEPLNNNTIARTASRIALYLVKDSEEVGGMIPEDLQHVHDFFVVNSCTVVTNLRSNVTEEQMRLVTDMQDVLTFQKQLEENVIFPSNLMIDLNVNEVLNDSFTGDRRDKAIKLLELARSEGNIGLMCGKIVEEFGNSLEVKEILDELCKLKLLVCTGLVNNTYVHHKHARPWLVHTYPNKRNERDSRVPMARCVMELGEEDVGEKENEDTNIVLEEYVEMQEIVQEDKKPEDFVDCDVLVVDDTGLKVKEEGDKMCVIDVVKPGSRKRNIRRVDVTMEVDCENRMEEEKGMEEENIDENSRIYVAEEEMYVVEVKDLEEEMYVEEVKELEEVEKCNEELEKKDDVEASFEKEGEEEVFVEGLEETTPEDFGIMEENVKALGEDSSTEGGVLQECVEELKDGDSRQVFLVQDDESNRSLQETEEGVSCPSKEGLIENCDKSGNISPAKVSITESFEDVNVGASTSKQFDEKLIEDDMIVYSYEMGGDEGQGDQVSATTGIDQVLSVVGIHFNLAEECSPVKSDLQLKQTNSDGGLCLDRFKDVNFGASTSKDVVCFTEDVVNQGSGDNETISDKRARLAATSRRTRSTSKSEDPVLTEPTKTAKETDHRNLSEPIKVLMRPWVRIDGTINRKSLDFMLSSVLSHIMQHPLATLAELQHRFLPALQPQHTRELAEFLEKLKCVESSVCVKSGKPSLFSKPCEVVIKKATGLEPPSEIRIEANKDAIVNLGKFISTKKYGEGFLTQLVDK